MKINIAKKFENVFGRKTKFEERSQVQKQLEKRAKIKIIRWSKKSKKSWTVPQEFVRKIERSISQLVFKDVSREFDEF